MHLKQVTVTGFRGIKSLDWTVNGTMIGLMGPGDSTKTTILDAIECALSPRWSLLVSDSDFYGGTPKSPVLVRVTVGDVPEELLKEDKFGLYARGWKDDTGVVDEPDDDCAPVLTIQLTITTDLEVSWAVVTDRHSEGKPITWRDRARLGVARLGAQVDRDLTWSRGSSLSRLTGTPGAEGILADAYRAARDTVAGDELADLVDAANTAAKRARELGATPQEAFRPALDAASMSVHVGALSLHDGPVPVRAAGLGTRRLVVLAIQQAIVPDGAILLIDEIENALEPHRIRRLVRHLRSALTDTDGDNPQSSDRRHGQVILTTQSAIAVVELDAAEARIVRSRDGQTEILAPNPELQGVIRSSPEALLGKRLVVCEGPTEVGLCWGLEGSWARAHSGDSTACRGVVFVDGGGSAAPKRAQQLRSLGYDVCYFADSDREIRPNAKALIHAGVKVIRWDGKVCTEERVFLDLPWKLLQEAFDIALEEHGEESVIAAVAHQLAQDANALSPHVASWKDCKVTEQQIREALGRAAKGTSKRPAWYKGYDKAKQLAKVILKDFSVIGTTDLGKKLQSLENWCYAC